MASNRDYLRKVYACTIQNDADSDVHVVLIYAPIPNADGEMKQTRCELDVVKDKRGYVLQKLVTRGTSNIHEVIEHIEVTRANGTKLELKAPFSGVKEPVSNWLFVVNNTEIKSVGIEK